MDHSFWFGLIGAVVGAAPVLATMVAQYVNHRLKVQTLERDIGDNLRRIQELRTTVAEVRQHCTEEIEKERSRNQELIERLLYRAGVTQDDKSDKPKGART